MKVFALCLGFALGVFAFDGNAVSVAPLPSAQSVMEKVLKAAEKEKANDKAFREGYAGYRVRLSQEFNSKGEVTKTNGNKRPFYPGSTPDKPGARTVASTNQPSYRQSDFSVTKELLDRFSFEVTGRENQAGRAMLVVRFQPAAKKLPVHGIRDKFINNMAGQLWIDEEDSLIAKAELRLRNQVNIAGGLGGAIKVFQYQFERTRTPEGIWYTSKSGGRIEARELLAQKRIAFGEHTENVVPVRKRPTG